ncbi:KAP family P-loop NTPase fold protein [Celeribacter arenosi]|uniref:P-loop NTPase fold protein n=1 Tax=Celeribacter arenosi TaxID=792649 RepID=A0ABP7JYI2_9RHOB
MRITPPHADIDIYSDGFAKHDILSRERESRNLSELVENIDEPLVIALDGAWGSGKSFFLKCWVGAHKIENKGKATTIYFDAFENDFLDDPLIGLTGVLADRMEKAKKPKDALAMVKTAAAKLWRPALRIGLAMGTAGASEAVGVVADAALERTEDELIEQVNAFWEKEDGKRAAMAEFRAALVKLTEPDDDGVPTKKFVFVVDELDRCRPDFALDLLEVMKHFFFVPGVHFVLGVNIKELLNTVRSRYGDRVDAETYLQKFVSVSLTLPDRSGYRGYPNSVATKYFEEMSRKMDINKNIADIVIVLITEFPAFRFQSIRQAQRVLTEIALIADPKKSIKNNVYGYNYTLASLILMKHGKPDLFRKAVSAELAYEDISRFIGLPASVTEESTFHSQVADYAWRSLLAPDTVDKNKKGFRSMWGGLGSNWPEDVIENLLNDYLNPIALIDEALTP